MIKVIEGNCSASSAIITVLMFAGGRAGVEVVLIQELCVTEEEDRCCSKIMDGNYI
jgi:hypothetical protein